MDAGGGGGGGSPAATATVAGVNPNLNGSAPPPFLSKTYEMVDDPATDAVVSWGPGNNSFVVWNTPEFARDLLPKYFKHSNFSSFVRQLNTYGFRKVDPDRWEFANEGFLRGQKHLLKTITRRKPSHAHAQPPQPQPQNASVSACVEVGKFGLEEEIERLKRDKNVLMQELVRLRQQQQATDHQLQTLVKRFQVMEQRQQQMMSFLAKAMQSPGFLAQLVQQNESSRRIVAANKKRRLPKQDGESASPDGQIIKYQPLMTEAAKEMLRQILKLGSSPRLESLSDSSNLLVENFPSSSQALHNSSFSQNSGVTLAEVPPNSGVSYVPVTSGFSAAGSPSAVSDVQSSAGATDRVATNELPDLGILSSVPEDIALSPNGMIIPEFPELEGLLSDGNMENFLMPEPDSVYANPITAGMDEVSMPIETENFTPESDINIVYDEDQSYDPFWEQIVTASLISGDVEEVQSSKGEAKETQPCVEKGWASSQNMEHLTEQMGLLNSDSTGK